MTPFFSSSMRFSCSSISFCLLMIRRNSSLSCLAYSASLRSLSMNCCCLASSSSASTSCFFYSSFRSLSLASRSLSSKALLALRASISDYLSAAFSCISLSRCTSFSFSSFTRWYSAYCSPSRMAFCLLYSTIFISSLFSSNFLYSF